MLIQFWVFVMKKISVRISAAFMEEPVMMNNGDIYHHVETNDLDISSDLKRAVSLWDTAYQRAFNDDYPPDSAFPSAQEEEAHAAEGRRLAVALQAELGEGFVVEYRG